MKTIYSPIAIDLGAKNNGGRTQIDIIDEYGELLNSSFPQDFCISINDNITFDQKKRRQFRHTRRNIDRRKFAKRILFEILSSENINLSNEIIFEGKTPDKSYKISIKEYLSSLMNRRGFTFLNDDNNPNFGVEEIPNWFNRLLPKKHQISGQKKVEMFISQLAEEEHDILNKNGSLYEIQKAFKIWNSSKSASVFQIKIKKNTFENIDELEWLNLPENEIKNQEEQCKHREKWLKFFQKAKIMSDALEYFKEECNNNLIQIIRKIIELPHNLIKDKKEVFTFKKDDKEIKKYFLVPESSNVIKKIENIITLHENIEKKDIVDFNKKIKEVIEERTEFINDLSAYLDVAITALETGSRPRKTYLKWLEEELEQKRFECHIPPENLYNLIGNIGNLQDRDLRNYFNSKSKQYKNLHAITKKSFAYKKILNEFKNENGFQKLLFQTKPQLTIPSYENQNNRKPPKCASICLKVEYKKEGKYKKPISFADIDKLKWEKFYQPFFQKNNVNISEFNKCDWPEILQITFDTNIIWGDKEEKYKGFGIGLKEVKSFEDYQNKEQFCFFQECCKIAELDEEKVYNIVREYFSQIAALNDGKIEIDNKGNLVIEKDNNFLLNGYKHQPLIRVCNRHPKINNNIADFHLRLRLQSNKPESIKELDEEFLPAITQSNFKVIAEMVQKHGSAINEILVSDNNIKNKIEKSIKEIAKYINQKIDWSKYEAAYIISQIYNIACKNRSGFAKQCTSCLENSEFRLKYRIRHIPRFTRFQHKPFDGMIGRQLDRTAWETAKYFLNKIKESLSVNHKYDEITQIDVPIFIEANSFRFNQETAKTSKTKKRINEKIFSQKSVFKDKKKRLINDSNVRCPYNGEVLGTTGEIDHIIPRASIYKTMNCELNLIYVSKQRNLEKLNAFPTFNDLDDSFFLKNNIPINDGLHNQLAELIEECEKAGTSLEYFKWDSQKRNLFRVGLFYDNDKTLQNRFIKIIKRLDATKVNGTQRYYGALLQQKLQKELRKMFPNAIIETPICLIANEDRYYWREKISENFPEITWLKKTNSQIPASHCLDAAICLWLGENELFNEGQKTQKRKERLKSVLNKIEKADLPEDENVVVIDVVRKTKLKRMDEVYNLKIDKSTKSMASISHFKDNPYALNFFHILVLPTKDNNGNYEMKIGFTIENSKKAANDTLKRIWSLLVPCKKIRRKFKRDLYQSFEQLQRDVTNWFNENPATPFCTFYVKKQRFCELAFAIQDLKYKKIEKREADNEYKAMNEIFNNEKKYFYFTMKNKIFDKTFENTIIEIDSEKIFFKNEFKINNNDYIHAGNIILKIWVKEKSNKDSKQFAGYIRIYDLSDNKKEAKYDSCQIYYNSFILNQENIKKHYEYTVEYNGIRVYDSKLFKADGITLPILKAWEKLDVEYQKEKTNSINSNISLAEILHKTINESSIFKCEKRKKYTSRPYTDYINRKKRREAALPMSPTQKPGALVLIRHNHTYQVLALEGNKSNYVIADNEFKEKILPHYNPANSKNLFFLKKSDRNIMECKDGIIVNPDEYIELKRENNCVEKYEVAVPNVTDTNIRLILNKTFVSKYIKSIKKLIYPNLQQLINDFIDEYNKLKESIKIVPESTEQLNISQTTNDFIEQFNKLKDSKDEINVSKLTDKFVEALKEWKENKDEINIMELTNNFVEKHNKWKENHNNMIIQKTTNDFVNYFKILDKDKRNVFLDYWKKSETLSQFLPPRDNSTSIKRILSVGNGAIKFEYKAHSKLKPDDKSKYIAVKLNHAK